MRTPWRRIFSDTRGGLIAEFAAGLERMVAEKNANLPRS